VIAVGLESSTGVRGKEWRLEEEEVEVHDDVFRGGESIVDRGVAGGWVLSPCKRI
jgi:hypothetical protein